MVRAYAQTIIFGDSFNFREVPNIYQLEARGCNF
jgi:hypothetical protein